MRSSSSASVPAAGGLRRAISLPWLVLYGLGTTIGAGIYALTGVVAGEAGMHAPLAFAAAALVALFSALSFAELSSRFPRAGGEAVYVLEGFGSLRLSRVVGLLVVLAGLVSAATVSVGMAGYATSLLALPRLPVVLAVVLVLGGVAAYGVRESVVAAGIMTLVEVGGLLAVIGAGAESAAELPARLHELVPRDAAAWNGIGAAALLCFYAFLGFEDMVNVAEEVRDVERVLPRAILATLGITTLLYVVLTSVAVLCVPPAELAASEAPLALVFAKGGGSAALLATIACIALANGALVQIVKASRVLYGLAREGALPARLRLGRVSPRTGTPLLATCVVTGVALAFALTLPLAELAALTSRVTLVTFALANASLLVLRRRGPPPAGHVAFPRWVPAAGLVASLGLALLDLLRPPTS